MTSPLRSFIKLQKHSMWTTLESLKTTLIHSTSENKEQSISRPSNRLPHGLDDGRRERPASPPLTVSEAGPKQQTWCRNGPKTTRPHSLTEKEAPQEQPDSLSGLSTIRKAARISSVWYSTVDPFTSDNDSSSMTTLASDGPKHLSSDCMSLSNSNLYWKPEQPPPSTTILRKLDLLASAELSSPPPSLAALSCLILSIQLELRISSSVAAGESVLVSGDVEYKRWDDEKEDWAFARTEGSVEWVAVAEARGVEFRHGKVTQLRAAWLAEDSLHKLDLFSSNPCCRPLFRRCAGSSGYVILQR